MSGSSCIHLQVRFAHLRRGGNDDMQLDRERLADMAARASTFHERVQNGYLVPHPDQSARDIDRRLERWQDRAAKGDPRFFAEVLAVRGLDLNAARRGLARVK